MALQPIKQFTATVTDTVFETVPAGKGWMAYEFAGGNDTATEALLTLYVESPGGVRTYLIPGTTVAPGERLDGAGKPKPYPAGWKFGGFTSDAGVDMTGWLYVEETSA